MKKQVLITAHSMDIGGIERSLIGLLNAFDYETYAVDVLLYSHRGEFLPLLPAQCNLLPEDARLATMLKPIMRVAPAHPLLAAARLSGKWTVGRWRRTLSPNSEQEAGYALLQAYWDYSVGLFRTLKKDYDAVLSFMWPHHFAAQKVNAQRKIAWVHTDFSRVGTDSRKDLCLWQSFDRIAAVSDDCAKTFSQRYPEVASLVGTVENVLSKAVVTALSEQGDTDDMPDDGGFRLLSVGRFCYAKGFDTAAAICRELLDRGVRLKWYIIGFGPDEALIRQKVADLGLEEQFLILGKKTNPYPYMRACDLYVQTSRYEGKAVTVREAQMLGKPVAITAYKTAGSQVRNGFDGVIVPQSVREAADGIAALLKDPEHRRTLSRHCAASDYENRDALERLYAWMEEDG